MKIAIATEEGLVSGHFGRCENFTICDIENGVVTDKKVISTAEHLHGALPAFLDELGVKVVISGGAGSGAVQKLNQLQIEILAGVSGKVEEVLNSYIKGELKSTAPECSEHHHEEHCGHNCGCSCH